MCLLWSWSFWPQEKELLQRFFSLSFWQTNPVLQENFNIAEKYDTTVFPLNRAFSVLLLFFFQIIEKMKSNVLFISDRRRVRVTRGEQRRQSGPIPSDSSSRGRRRVWGHVLRTRRRQPPGHPRLGSIRRSSSATGPSRPGCRRTAGIYSGHHMFYFTSGFAHAWRSNGWQDIDFFFTFTAQF